MDRPWTLGYFPSADEAFHKGSRLKNSCVGVEKLYSPRSPASGGSYQGGFFSPESRGKTDFLNECQQLTSLSEKVVERWRSSRSRQHWLTVRSDAAFAFK
jgi:hypothetical protein